MRVRGRRHWTESVTLHDVTPVTSGPNTGSEEWTVITPEPLPATVQPVSDAELIQHGITTTNPVYWLRIEPHDLRVGTGVTWLGSRYKIISLSEGSNIDTEGMMELIS